MRWLEELESQTKDLLSRSAALFMRASNHITLGLLAIVIMPPVLILLSLELGLLKMCRVTKSVPFPVVEPFFQIISTFIKMILGLYIRIVTAL